MKPLMIYITAAMITLINSFAIRIFDSEWINFYQIIILYILNIIFILLKIIYDNKVKD